MLFLPVSLCLWGSFSYAQEMITVAVASSYYEKAKQYNAVFEAKHPINIRLILGSTGRLYNQIKQGAPFDILVAAGSQYIPLDKPKKNIGSSYLGIQIGHVFNNHLKRLTQTDIQKIAIANPKTAPFGTVAKQFLKKKGMWKTLKSKLVYAQNAMQASMMVNQGLVDAAFVPVKAAQDSIARIPYTAFLLSNSREARRYFQGMGVLSASQSKEEDEK